MSLSGASSSIINLQNKFIKQQKEMIKQQSFADMLAEAEGKYLSDKLDSIEHKKAIQMQTQDGNLSYPLNSAQRICLQDDMEQLMFSNIAISSMNIINGTNNNDIIKATQNEDGSLTINVNGEEQTYSKEEVADGFIINSDDGNDIIDMSSSNANFIINLGDGNNSISLGNGRNITLTGNGNNVITGSEMPSKGTSIYTGSGNNNISLGEGSSNKVITNGGSNTITTGQDSVSNIIDKNYTDKPSTIKLDTDTDNFITTTGSSNITVGDGNNNIQNNKGNSYIKAGNGNNIIISSGNINNIQVGDGNNYIEGGSDNDNILVGNGDNVIYGLNGNDTIVAGNGNNYIDGGNNDDTIIAGEGKNIIAGGLGNDKITATGVDGTIIDDSNGENINAEENNIILYDSESTTSLGNSVVSYGSKQFRQRIQSDLEVFRGTQTGRKLLFELDQSGKTTTIEETYKQNGFANIYNPNDNGKQYVKPNGTRGEGANAWIEFNPAFNGPANGRPVNVLFHELTHAYNITTGTMANGNINENGLELKAGEHQAVGLELKDFPPVEHPDGTVSASNPKGISENDFRTEIGIENRKAYN